MLTERLESMSPRGFLRLMRQDDGDICIQVGEGDDNGGWRSFASVEFCTPMIGGGGSSRTWAALVQLMGAMAADNLDATQNGRRSPAVNDEVQKALVEWAEQCAKTSEDSSNILGKDER